jgi:hypothetical protein
MSAGARVRAGLVDPSWWAFVAVILPIVGLALLVVRTELVHTWRLRDPSA